MDKLAKNLFKNYRYSLDVKYRKKVECTIKDACQEMQYFPKQGCLLALYLSNSF